jgi:exonuclease VII large subunit
MSDYTSTISEALKSIELTNNEVKLRGELRIHNAFSRRGIFYAELFDGRTTLGVAFDPKEVDIPEQDCFVEAAGEVVIYGNGACLMLWVEHWSVIGDSRLQDDITYSYQILKRTKKKRSKRRLPKKIRKVLVIGPKTDAAHATQDFLNALHRHSEGNPVEITVRKIKMRGSDAAFDIAEEIEELRHRKEVDVYCIVSGGGDKYELDQVFSAPVLVEAVCLSKIPCLVGVGHSKDNFPLNEAASWCADTPSAAGAMLGETIRKRSKKGCYVVTATCGASSPEVRFCYHVRDEYLTKTRLGRIVIKSYYCISPSLAALISKHAAVKTLSYILIVRPVYRVLSRILD